MIRTALTTVLALLVVGSIAVGPAAAASISITDVSLPDSVSQGDSFAVQLDVSGSDVQNVEAALSVPDGISCSPAGTQSVSLDSGGSGQATFDCDAEATGDYSGEITASLTADETSTSNTRSDSTQTGIEVLSPASLSLTTAIGSTTIDEGASTTLDVIVENSGDAATSYDVTVENVDGFSSELTSGSTSGDIAGDSTDTVSYDLTGDSSGTYTVNVTTEGGNGQTLSETYSLDVQSSGGGGGSSASTVTATATATPTTTATATPTTDITETETSAEEEDTVTATATVTATPTLEPTADGDDADQLDADSGASDTSGPGFGVLVGITALAAVALLATRRP